MTEPRDNMVLLTGQGLTPWKPETERNAREVFEEAMRDCEQVFVIGIRRKPDSAWNTETNYVHAVRLNRTCFFEFVGAVRQALRDLEEADSDP